MGRKRLDSPDHVAIFLTLTKMFVPETILENFDIYDVQKRSDNWVIELREKENPIPLELSSDAVLDGFCNPIEVMSLDFR